MSYPTASEVQAKVAAGALRSATQIAPSQTFSIESGARGIVDRLDGTVRVLHQLRNSLFLHVPESLEKDVAYGPCLQGHIEHAHGLLNEIDDLLTDITSKL